MLLYFFCPSQVSAQGARGVSDDEGIFLGTPDDYGGTGLMQMPDARFFGDGELMIGGVRLDPYRRLFITHQFLPWLQGTFRYTSIVNRFVGTADYLDKSFDVKVRLWKEGDLWPQVAAGLRDINGTGLFASEYVVASRRWYDLDLSLGIAWGYSGSRGNISNPLTIFGEEMGSRSSTDWGQFSSSFFRGKRAAVFGGIQYRTPIDGLTLKLEYDGNDYQSEAFDNVQPVDSPVNLGVSYSPIPWLNLALAWERGNTVVLRGSLHTNLNEDKGAPKIGAPPLPVPRRPGQGGAPVSEDARSVSAKPAETAADMLYDEFERLGLVVLEIAADGRDGLLRLDISEHSPAESAVARAALAVARNPALGPFLTTTVVAERNGAEVWRKTLERGELERQAAFAPSHASAQPAPHRPQAAPPTPPALPRRTRAEIETAGQHIFAELESQGLRGLRFDFEGRGAALHLVNDRYRNPAIALGRAARVVSRHAPSEVEELTIVLFQNEVPVSKTVLLRKDVEKALGYEGSSEEVLQHARFEPPPRSHWPGAAMTSGYYPDLDWTLAPKLRSSVGDPDKVYAFQIYGLAGANLKLFPGLALTGNFGFNLYNNFGELNRGPGSGLPHVRSEILSYLKDSPQWLDRLAATYAFSPYREWYVGLTGGIYERMYTGFGGELLYRPQGRSWAVGLEVDRVRRRDTKGRFGLLDYAVATHHLTWYQKLPFYNLMATVSAGRYLAGDRGVTFDLSRTFENGVNIGVFATRTNVPAEVFGEGSFDKGFHISIPFDLFTISHTKSNASLLFRPLTRDGGQKVIRPMSLYGLTDGGGALDIQNGWDDLLR